MGQIGGDLVLVEGLGSGKWMGMGQSAQVRITKTRRSLHWGIVVRTKDRSALWIHYSTVDGGNLAPPRGPKAW